jgi:uncharacterized protein YfkK (UPF0435 family)
MSLLNFITGMKAVEKENVVELLVSSADDLSQVREESLADLYELIKKSSFPLGKQTVEAFNFRRENRSQDIIRNMNLEIMSVVANFRYLAEEVDTTFADRIYSDGLDSKQAVILRAADHAFFIRDAVMKFIDHTLIAIAINEKWRVDHSGDESWVEDKTDAAKKLAETKYYSRLMTLGVMLEGYGVDKREFTTNIKEMLIVDVAGGFGKNGDPVQAQAADPIDPAETMGFNWSPFYFIGRQWAEYRTSEHRVYSERKRAVELRIAILRGELEEQKSPVLERELEYCLQRVDDLSAALRDIEG